MANKDDKKKQTTKDFPPKYHNPRHWDDVLDNEFKGESDRACVILSAALLDSALEILLKTHLISCSSNDDPLFDGANAPLSTFSSRIDIAYRIGLIDSSFARSLHLVRRIRNDFAHNVVGCSFQDASVVGRITELRRLVGLPENEMEFRSSYPAGARGDFQLIISWMQWLLRSLIEDIDPIDNNAWTSVYYPKDKKSSKKQSHKPPQDNKTK